MQKNCFGDQLFSKIKSKFWPTHKLEYHLNTEGCEIASTKM